MGMALGWMALALAIVGAGPEAGRGGGPITYSVRFVEVEGLGWRDAVFTRLTPVTRQGAATVWTAPSDVAERMAPYASKTSSSNVFQAPRVTAWAGVPAHITTRTNRQFVTQVSWNGDDRPVETRPETVRTGSAATVTGRKIDQGILVQMVLEDTQIIAVHAVALRGPKDVPRDPAARKTAHQADDCCEGASSCCQAGEKAQTTGTSKPTSGAPDVIHGVTLPSVPYIKDDLKYLVDVPEIGSQEVAGEWLIPKDGILLVSFGPHTVAGKDGKAVIRERLAIVEAAEATGPGVASAPRQGPRGTATYQFRAIPMPAPAAMAAAPVAPAPAVAPTPSAVPAAPAAAMPPMPSRSIPQGYHADGKAAELPPLPPDEADADDEDESAETRPSPQAKKLRKPAAKEAEKPEPANDTAMRKVQFSIANVQAIPSLFHTAAPTVGLQFLLPIKPVSMKLPFNRRLELEIYGRVVPAPEPARSSADLATKPAGDGATTKK